MTAQAAPLALPEMRAKAKAMRPLALEYCAKQGKAEVLREEVDAIARRLLAAECPLFHDRNGTGERITEPKDYWLCEDDAAIKAYYAAQDRELRAIGLKPAEMGDEYCPALVAENDARKARRAVINALAPLAGIDPKWLLGEKEERFFELAMQLILQA
jgi:hypothetical protein